MPVYGQRISELNEAPVIEDDALLAIVTAGETKKISFSVIKDYILNMSHPIGSYYLSDDPTEPAELFGGTWVRIQGRVLYGADGSHAAGTEFGSATTTLSTANLPAHAHGIPATGGSTSINGGHKHPAQYRAIWMISNDGEQARGWGDDGAPIWVGPDGTQTLAAIPRKRGYQQTAGFLSDQSGIGAAGDHNHSIGTSATSTYNAGSGQAFNNIQPSHATYIWKRTA